MRSARLGSYLILAVVAASGCRTAGVDTYTRRDPVQPPPAALDVAKFVEDNNRNASRIESLKATSLSLNVTAGPKKSTHGVDGRLALERPRNFKLEVSSARGQEAEIGSNEEKFWLWTRSEKQSYYCNYDAAGNTPLSATLQPDWIIEALGLRVIPPQEAEHLTLTRGEDPGTLVLTHKPLKNGTEVVIRKTILLESTHQVLEHRLYSQRKELLARAKIERYQNVAVPSENGEEPETVLLPERIKIEWIREQMAMDVKIPGSSVQVNPTFNDSVRAELFAEAPRKGVKRVNLAGNMPTNNGSEGVTTIRESLPPPSRRIELGSPESDVTQDRSSRRNDLDPDAITASLPSTRASDLVGAAVPQAPEIKYAEPSRPSSFADMAAPYIEQ